MSKRSKKTARTDLYSNKDALLTISTFLSLKQLNMLREISKQFNSWLSDYSSFSWKNRIELSFPTTFQQVLKEDISTQIERLQKFDSLVDSGHQVSFFSTQSLLKHTSAVEVNAKYQVPWSRNLFLIVFNKTSVMVFDAETGKDTCRIDFFEMKSVDTVLFDIQNNKVGFINKDMGVLKLYMLKNGELNFEVDFTCDALKEDENNPEGIIPQIYGDNIILRKMYGTKLAWHSLSSNKEVQEIPVPGDDGVFFAPSLVAPVMYVSRTEGSRYKISVVDCLLQSDEPMKERYYGPLGIEMDNCGDGVDGIDLIETEDGSVLNIYLLGTGDKAFKAIDLKSGKSFLSLYFESYWNYKSIKYNPGSKFYCIQGPGHEPSLAIKDAEKDYEDEVFDVKKEVKEEESYDEDEENNEDPTNGAYFTFNSKNTEGKWLNKDLFTVKTFYEVTKEVEPEPETKSRGKAKKGVKRQAKAVKQEPKIITEIKSRQVFFSIAKRAIIGSIDDDINDVFIAGNMIVAFTAQGDFYRLTLSEDNENKEDKDKEDKEDHVMQVEPIDEPQKKSGKKRKRSEIESGEVKQPKKPANKKRK